MESFQLKADFMPLTVFKLTTTDLKIFSTQLGEVVAKAPKYFVHAPVLLDVSGINNHANIDLAAICGQLQAQKILPIGVRGLDKDLHSTAVSKGLAIIKSAVKTPDVTTTTEKTRRKTKIMTKAIRSGAQVYAPDGDLIIMAAVNAGAEVIADGNIHIYGPLRGRALAGAQGDQSALIFCQELEAELISIAGRYLIKENLQLPDSYAGGMLQIALEDQHINIKECK